MENESRPNSITVDGVEYVKKSGVPTGNRAVVVLTRGWIYAGDIERRDDRIFLKRVVWVFSWRSVGFDGVIKNPIQDDVTIKEHADIDFPAAAEVFAVPVSDNWGLKS